MENTETKTRKKNVTLAIFDRYNSGDKIFLKCSIGKYVFVSSDYAYRKIVLPHFPCNAFLTFSVLGVADSLAFPSDLAFYRANTCVSFITRKDVA